VNQRVRRRKRTSESMSLSSFLAEMISHSLGSDLLTAAAAAAALGRERGGKGEFQLLLLLLMSFFASPPSWAYRPWPCKAMQQLTEGQQRLCCRLNPNSQKRGMYSVVSPDIVHTSRGPSLSRLSPL
jgi:hypothetical protein